MPETGSGSTRGRGDVYKDKEKPTSIRQSNITAAKGNMQRTHSNACRLDRLAKAHVIHSLLHCVYQPTK